MIQSRVLITGATGSVGRAVTSSLRALAPEVELKLAIGHRHFLANGALRPDSAASLGVHAVGVSQADDRSARAGEEAPTASESPIAEAVAFDFTDESTWARALEGVSRIFLMRPPHISNVKRDMEPFIAYCAERRIEHVSFLSVRGAESNSIVPHHKIEKAVEANELSHTFFRPSFFMQNLTTTHAREIQEERRIFVPAGDGKTNFVDVDDIGEAIARVLLDPPATDAGYEITGPESLTYDEVAEKLTQHLGVEITYEPAGLFSFLRYHLRRGKKLGFVIVMYLLYSATRMGKAAGESPELERIIGRAPRTIDEFIVDNRALLLDS